MSLSHHGYYGPPPSGFGGSHYPQYPHSDHHHQRQYHHHQPQPPPPPQAHYYRDPITFRRDFSSRLSVLQENSRPDIQALSMLAHEYTRYSEIVAQCLESHIRSVPPWMKLPAFYLLDMISKNIYEPYSREFQAFVTPLFLETYGLVDETTRQKLEELLLTWRTGSPSRQELFGAAVQVSLERGIWGEGSSHASSSGSSSGHITKAQVLSELDFAYSQKERAARYDPMAQTHATVLQQLRGVVENGVSQQELHQILSQLRNLVKSSAPPPPVQLPPAQSAPQSWPPQQPGLPSYPHSQLYPPVKAEPMIPPPSSAPMPIGALLSSLMRAGVVSASGTPTGAGSSSTEETAPQEVERENARMYRHAILSEKIQLTNADITKKRPAIQYFLYDQLSAQCRQCGIRYPDTVVGKKSYQDHMDMHFRQNRKSSQNLGRGHSRSWFVGLDDWTHDSVKINGKGSRPLDAKAAAVAESAKREAELRAQYVVIPPGDEAKQVSCPICKETLPSEFLEQDEEWVWRNAIRKDEQIYHATCHADALNATTSLTARLRSGLGGPSRSRSKTPDLLATPPRMIKALSPSPDSKSAGMKRKADESSSLNHDGQGTPPTKKIAVGV